MPRVVEPAATVPTAAEQNAVESSAGNDSQMKLALEVFAAVGVLLIALCVVLSVRQSRTLDSEQVAWQPSSPLPRRVSEERSNASPNGSPATAFTLPSATEKTATTGEPSPRRNVLPTRLDLGDMKGRDSVAGARETPAVAVTMKPAEPPAASGDPRALPAAISSAKAASVLSAPGGKNDHVKLPSATVVLSPSRNLPPRPVKTAEKKPDPAIYLDDLPELGSEVGIGLLGKHGETGYPQFESEYGPKVTFHGKKPEHALSVHPPRKGVSYVAYVLKGEYRTLRATAVIMEVNPAEAARVASEPFFMGGPASPLTFRVIGDGKVLWESRPLQKCGDSHRCNVSVEDVNLLELEVSCPGLNSYCWAAWIEPAVGK
jgi:hypothetical protein